MVEQLCQETQGEGLQTPEQKIFGENQREAKGEQQMGAHPANGVVVHVHLGHLGLPSDGMRFCHPHNHDALLTIYFNPCPSLLLRILEHPLHRIVDAHTRVAHTLGSVNTPSAAAVAIVTPGNLIDCIWIQQKCRLLLRIRHFQVLFRLASLNLLPFLPFQTFFTISSARLDTSCISGRNVNRYF